jgi:choline dehydrogenase-like flavoprotein
MKMLDHKTLTWGFRAEADPGTNGRAIVYRAAGSSAGRRRSTGSSTSAANPRITTTGRSSAIAAGAGTTCCRSSRRPNAGRARAARCAARTGRSSPRRWTARRSAPGVDRGRQAARPRIPRGRQRPAAPAPATASAGASRPAAAGAAPAPRAPICARPEAANLQLVTKALVHRVVFDGKRAVGVEYSRGGPVERADAGREVILSAGAIGSPHMLQLSGVGDPEHLGQDRRAGRARAARRRQEHAGPLRRAHVLSGPRRADRQREIARPAARRRGAALAVHRQGHADLQRLARRRLGQGAGGIGDPDMQVLVRAGQLQGRPDRQARGDARPHRRRVADAAAVARLCRGQVNRPGDMPAINPRYLSEEPTGAPWSAACALRGGSSTRRR